MVPTLPSSLSPRQPPPPPSLTCGLQEMPDADVHRGYAATQRLGALRAERADSGGLRGRHAHWVRCGGPSGLVGEGD